jgi:hypothetical protein
MFVYLFILEHSDSVCKLRFFHQSASDQQYRFLLALVAISTGQCHAADVQLKILNQLKLMSANLKTVNVRLQSMETQLQQLNTTVYSNALPKGESPVNCFSSKNKVLRIFFLILRLSPVCLI